MFYLFLLAVAAAGGALYLLVIMSTVPGFRAHRYGELEPLPADLGRWKLEESSEEGGERRETRLIFEEGGLLRAGRLVRQVRYRDPKTNAIGRVLPDEVIKRRRIRAQT